MDLGLFYVLGFSQNLISAKAYIAVAIFTHYLKVVAKLEPCSRKRSGCMPTSYVIFIMLHSEEGWR